MRFCIDRNTAEIQNLGTIAGQPANSISVAEDEKGTMQFFALGMANYMGGGDALLVFQQHNGELIPMHGSGDIRSLAEHKPMAARSPQGKGIYHLFTVGQGQVPYMHTADMSADGHSGGLKGSFTQTNRPLDNSGALYGQHISVAEDGNRGLRAYMSRHIPAAEMSQPGITELVVFNISPSGDVAGPQVLASIESNDRLGRGEITLSPDGRTLAYFNRNRYLGGFDYHTVEIYTIALDQSGLMAASEPSLKAKGADYGTGRKGSIEWQGSDLYWNQYGLYSDIGQDKIFARVLKTGQTQPVSSGEYGDLRFSGSDVYKLGQAGTSLKTASATAAADDRPGYLPGQPWRASGTGPQLSYRSKGIRQYELTDHLGNVRAVIGDRLKTETDGTATAYKPELLSATDYFPFGMQMPERVFSGSEYRYGFQGQETENELYGDGNASFYKYRISNNWNGRFFAVDPLAADYPWNSSYAFSENRVIDGVELEGLEVVRFGSAKATPFYMHKLSKDDIEKVLEANYKYHQGNLSVDDFAGTANDKETWMVSNRIDYWGNSTGTLIVRDGKYELRKDISQWLASFDERSQGNEDGANTGASSAKGNAIGLDIVTDMIPGGIVGQIVQGTKGVYGSITDSNIIYDINGVDNSEDDIDDVLNGLGNVQLIFTPGFNNSNNFGSNQFQCW